MTIKGLPLRPGATGEIVRDLHRRLERAGVDASPSDPATFGSSTARAIEAFQSSRGLPVTGTCDRHTWAALIESNFALGDRVLYHHSPMLRGDDVAALQLALGELGFDAGRVDGIFGPDTVRALTDFQRNAGLITDGIAGPDSVRELNRYRGRTSEPTAVAHVRERERLRTGEHQFVGLRIALGEQGGAAALSAFIARELRTAGAAVLQLDHPDAAAQAGAANAFEADLFIGITLEPTDVCRFDYFATKGFESVGGKHLATILAATPCPALEASRRVIAGMTTPPLRETRMPAILMTVGPTDLAVRHGSDLAALIVAATTAWALDPVDDLRNTQP